MSRGVEISRSVGRIRLRVSRSGYKIKLSKDWHFSKWNKTKEIIQLSKAKIHYKSQTKGGSKPKVSVHIPRESVLQTSLYNFYSSVSPRKIIRRNSNKKHICYINQRERFDTYHLSTLTA